MQAQWLCWIKLHFHLFIPIWHSFVLKHKNTEDSCSGAIYAHILQQVYGIWITKSQNPWSCQTCYTNQYKTFDMCFKFSLLMHVKRYKLFSSCSWCMSKKDLHFRRIFLSHARFPNKDGQDFNYDPTKRSYWRSEQPYTVNIKLVRTHLLFNNLGQNGSSSFYALYWKNTFYPCFK